MAGNRSFGTVFEEIRAARGEQVEQAIRDLQRTEPEWEHHTAAGRVAHPTTGELNDAPRPRAGVRPHPHGHRPDRPQMSRRPVAEVWRDFLFGFTRPR